MLMLLMTLILCFSPLVTSSINKVAPKVRKVLQLFRLRQINNGVFIKLNKATINMLRIAEPYITWGYPNLKSVRELIYKRGFVKVSHPTPALLYQTFVYVFSSRSSINSIRDNAFQSPTTSPLNVNWRRTMYNASKTWSMKFSRLAPNSSTCRTSCGHSNWIHPLVGGVRRTITTWMVVISAIAKIKSTISSERWFKAVLYERILSTKIQRESGKIEKSFFFMNGFRHLADHSAERGWSLCRMDRGR